MGGQEGSGMGKFKAYATEQEESQRLGEMKMLMFQITVTQEVDGAKVSKTYKESYESSTEALLEAQEIYPEAKIEVNVLKDDDLEDGS
jgi:hypothetical protein